MLLLQGANRNVLGRRQPAIHGTTPAAELAAMLILLRQESPAAR